MKIYPKGDPFSKVWVVIERPYEKDGVRGYVFSDTMGYIFDRIYQEAGLSALCPYYVMALKDDNEIGKVITDEDAIANFIAEVHKYKPPFIIGLGAECGALLCPETKSRKKPHRCSLEKYAGSLLISPHVNYEHYVVLTHAPDFICAAWDYREVQIFIDLGHIKEEYEYWSTHQAIQPLPAYNLILEPEYEHLLALLDGYKEEFRRGITRYISVDIETIRPIKNSAFKGNPGYPYTISIAPNPVSGVAFTLWERDVARGVALFRAIDNLLATVPQIGQNYFNFDAHYCEGLGFRPRLKDCQDTLIRHHILWTELPHKLQFLTKQYTRQPYYKDEGKGWTPKHKKQLLHYNALDAVVTYQVWMGQEQEFNDRPYLR